jgi:RHS repeat-associated protein
MIITTTLIISYISPSYSARYTFSGKERDEESGFSYFGARYYNSAYSIWMSVDPMADKYPSLSPYVYCGNNPVKLVDPSGEEIGYVDEASREKINALTNKNSSDYSRAFTRQYRRLERSKQVYNFHEASEHEITTNTTGKILKNDEGEIDIIHSSVTTARTSKEGGFSQQYATLFEETFHAADYDRGRLDLNNPTCMDEARAWKFAAKAPGTNYRLNIVDVMGRGHRDYTFAHFVSNESTINVAKHFKAGSANYLDWDNNEHWMINSNSSTKTKIIGLYHHLNLR